MKSNDENILDLQVMEKILQTLTMQFEYKVTTIEESKDLSTMTLDELMGSLQVHEQCVDERSQIEAKEALENQVRKVRITIRKMIISNTIFCHKKVNIVAKKFSQRKLFCFMNVALSSSQKVFATNKNFHL